MNDYKDTISDYSDHTKYIKFGKNKFLIFIKVQCENFIGGIST